MILLPRKDTLQMIKDYIKYEGPVMSAIFMIKSLSRAVSNNGNPYLSLVLQDVSGTLDAKKWTIDDEDIEIAQPGKLIRVDGQILIYKGHPQLKINYMEGVQDSEVDLSKYVPVAPVPLEDLKELFDSYLNQIEDLEIKTLTQNLIKENYTPYTTYPAAITVHHAYISGLLYHSLCICKSALEIQKDYPFLIKDYLIAGSLLHDIGKTRELNSAIASNYTEEGNLIGHITIGAMMVYEEGKKEKISEEKLTVLIHMILSHHGKPEFGSAKVPLTAEAYVLHVLDDLDAKMETLRNYWKNTEEGDFTSKIPWMENVSFFKPHSLKKSNTK